MRTTLWRLTLLVAAGCVLYVDPAPRETFTDTNGGPHCDNTATLILQYRHIISLIASFDSPNNTSGNASYRIAHISTHETGSSTFHRLLSMLAVNHDLLPVFSAMPSKHSFTHASCAGLLKVPALRNRFDIEFRFVRSMQSILDGNDSPCYRDNLYAFDVMESYSWLLENPIITTTFRNPAEQSLLFLFKYHRPGCKLYGDGKNCYPFQHSLKLAQRKEKSLRGADFSMFNIASHELGIVDADGMHHFIENAVESDKMHFILFEKWFESLVALRKKTGWRFSDMLHIRAPSAEAHLQSEGAPWVQTLMKEIAKASHLDSLLLEAVLQQHRRNVQRAKDVETSSGSQQFDAEVAALEDAVSLLENLCQCTDFLAQFDVFSSEAERRIFHLRKACQVFDLQPMTQQRFIVGSWHKHRKEEETVPTVQFSDKAY